MKARANGIAKYTRILIVIYAAVCFNLPSHAAENTTIHIIHIDDVQTTCFDGWGTSLAWWANAFGSSGEASTLADLCFTTATVNFLGSEVPGLGMNIVRYNVGASRTGADAENDPQTSGAMARHKRIRAFQLPPVDGGASQTWDWNADTAQRDMLLKAIQRGADQVEFFSNSPPWWMCINGSPAGGDGGADNLRIGMDSAFADYLATVVEHAQQSWGIRVDYVEPFNEPSANWWKFPTRQEGCYFSRPRQRQVLANLASSLQARRLDNVWITASDENDIGSARETWKQLGPEIQNQIPKLNVHAYSGLEPYRGRGRAPLRAELAGRKLWMSEFCDKDPSGLTLAQTMLLDLKELKADGWCYWQAVDGGVWGLIRANYRESRLEQVNLKYFVFAHFSRHITPGSSILETACPELVAAWRPSDKTITLVHLSGDVEKPMSIRIANRQISGPVKAWSTQLSPGAASNANAYRQFTLEATGDDLRLPATTNTLTTLQVATN